MNESALLTDLYQLTMLQAYHGEGMNDTAVFEFFVRKLPPGRNFLIAAGLEQALDYLEQLSFTADELDWLAAGGRFRKEFVDSLRDLRFTGTVLAMAEGTPFFADEPIFQVVAPLREAQLAESRLINLLQFQTMVASKAARVRQAAGARLVVDFGLRRAHGAEAGLLSARAAYIAGFDGTATVAAGRRWDIPLYGTMAHSFVQAHDSEWDAFDHFARNRPAGVTLLIDTWDTEAAARMLVPLARRLAADGIAIQAVRLDSGDLGEHARRVRAIFDAAGLAHIRIFASSNLDEYKIRDLVATGAPIDGFGVGTRMNVSADQPYLDCAYKLVEYAGRPRCKRSEGKVTWPGRKQVYRHCGPDGLIASDLVTLAKDHDSGVPLLLPSIVNGRRLGPAPSLAAIRRHARNQIETLPEGLRDLGSAAEFRVEPSASLKFLAKTIGQGVPDQPFASSRLSAEAEPI